MDTIRLMASGSSGLGVLSKEMIMRSYIAYKHGDSEALEALVAHYSYLAFEKAFRLFHRLGDEARDLAQELLMEVVEVLKKPLPKSSKNLTFWVNVSLDRRLREYLTQDNLGTYRQNRLLKRLVKVRLDLEEELGRAPTHPELAEALGIDEAALERLLYLEEANRILSLSSPHPETGMPLEEMVAAEEVLEDLEEALQKARLGLEPEALSTLERFLAGEEVDQAALEALAAAIKAQIA
jgi:RNA polymerase primary sigma factor